MFASVRLGLAAAKDLGATGAILLPVDHPMVTGNDIRAITEALTAGAEIAVASHAGRKGHPIGLSRVVMEQIAADSSIGTLREVLHRDPGRVVAVSVGAGALFGVNTKAELDRISEHGSSVN
jgi:molybdenum cofactor cytidylyltransferase